VTVLFSRASLCKTCVRSLVAVVIYVLTINPVAAQTPKSGGRVFPGEYVVTLSPSAREARAMRALEAHGVAGINRLARGIFLLDSVKSARRQRSGATRASVPVDPHDTFCRDLVAAGRVAACSPNYEVRIDAAAPNDPMFSSLWGLGDGAGIAAQRAWNVSTGSSDVVVAVIDTGVDYTHPDLRANMWSNPGEIPGNGIDDDANGYIDDVHGINATRGAAYPGDPQDDNGHGTHVAGTIGAVGNNDQGVVGINQHVKIMALRFLGAAGAGSLSDAIKAIDYMITMKSRGVDIRVANNSWGGSGYAAALGDAIQRVEEAGIVFVAAAGNDGTDNDVEPSYPANFEMNNVVSVAALDEWGNLASFSNYGATTVDIAAPGADIYSTFPGNRYVKLSGTSMATPHVVGALALLFAAEPNLSYAEGMKRLYESGRDRSSLYDGGRRVPLVRTQRSTDVGRMLFNETKPLLGGGGIEPSCAYDLDVSNLAPAGTVDTSADSQPIVQQADEGEFYRLDLPFPFPFYETSLSTLFISPNGVVYANAPSSIDFEPGRQAPLQSIAAFHVDMVPLSTGHGVRVFKGSDKVTILWTEGLFAAQKTDSEVQVRLTLHATGRADISVSFGEGADAASLRRLAFGDPFQQPAMRPAALIGVSGSSTTSSSTVDLTKSLEGLVSSLDQRLVLGVSMVPRCKGGTKPSVTSIGLRRGAPSRSTQAVKVRGYLAGDGDGDVPVSLAVDAFQCEGFKMVRLQDGRATFRVQIPRGPSRVAASSGSARGSVRLSSNRGGGDRSRAKRGSGRMCRAILRSLRATPAG
jgi:subtilisin family serine protease